MPETYRRIMNVCSMARASIGEVREHFSITETEIVLCVAEKSDIHRLRGYLIPRHISCIVPPHRYSDHGYEQAKKAAFALSKDPPGSVYRVIGGGIALQTDNDTIIACVGLGLGSSGAAFLLALAVGSELMRWRKAQKVAGILCAGLTHYHTMCGIVIPHSS